MAYSEQAMTIFHLIIGIWLLMNAYVFNRQRSMAKNQSYNDILTAINLIAGLIIFGMSVYNLTMMRK
jgi:hypothetical protein